MLSTEARAAQATSLIDLARNIAPIVRDEAYVGEQQRALTPKVVEALRTAGLFHAAVPKEFGGAQADPLSMFEIIEEVSCHDGSAGWVVGQAMITTGVACAHVPDAGAEEVFRADTLPIVAGGFPPWLKAVQDSGGHRLSGTFRTASGCRHAQWLVVTASIDRDEGTKANANAMSNACTFLVPAEALDIQDTWRVSGLEATGSHDVKCNDVYVPAQRSFKPLEERAKRGQQLHDIPLSSLFMVPQLGFSQGVARRALELVLEITDRQRLMSKAQLRDRPAFQQAFARVDTKLRATRALTEVVLSEVWEMRCAGEEIPLHLRGQMAAITSHSYETAREVIDVCFRAAGASEIYRAGALQRCSRDISAGSLHVLASEELLEVAGQIRLGVTPSNSAI
ncbi:MAG: alkylation response protein AidB-like acyl-CoA dehydrogenase [Gammaproteobacteria bacterium]|jgi:alkylation response protein AidB-like acyl-CoA dehydrogenase